MVVRMRHTRSQTGQSRAHKKLQKPALTRDGSGGVSIRHRASAITGKYKDRQVIDVGKKISKKLSKKEQVEKTEEAEQK